MINLSGQKKLFLSFGLILILFLISNFTYNNTVQSIADSEKELNNVHYKVALRISEIRSHLNHNRADVLNMILSDQNSDQLELDKAIKERSALIADDIQLLNSLETERMFESQLLELSKLINEYDEARNTQIDLIKNGKINEATLMGVGLQADRYNKIRDLSFNMGQAAELHAQNQMEYDIKKAHSSQLRAIFFGLATFVISIVVVLVLNKTIIKPLQSLTVVASKIASGDLNVTFSATARKDEIGVLSQTFGLMIDSLKSFVKEINEGVNLLASSSTQILAATSQVAAGTAETATAISETSTTVEEVQLASRQSMQIAKNISDNSLHMVEIYRDGQKAVDETIAGMNNIHTQMDSIAQTIIRLNEQSQSIGGIIAAVTDIADQSNLLAVNAAIEAAKAGDQGKGFAVVAKEIKNLAGQSKQATLQVRNILNDIQKATTTAVLATEQGSNAVMNGLKQSVIAGDAIRILSESSNEAVQSSAQIVASSQQQVIGMDQIGVAMQNINQAGTETAVSMVQSEKSARNLYELGQKLKVQAEKFNV